MQETDPISRALKKPTNAVKEHQTLKHAGKP